MKRIEIQVKTKSRYPGVVRVSADKYKVSVASAPEQNAANQEVISRMAEFLGIHKNQIRLIQGWKSRFKVIEITNP